MALALRTVFVSCHSTNESAARRFKLRGTVISVDRQEHQAVINQEEIPGFMAAMTMSYKIKDQAALERLQPGDQITADVVVLKNDSWLENVVIAKKGSISGSNLSSQLIIRAGGLGQPFHYCGLRSLEGGTIPFSRM